MEKASQAPQALKSYQYIMDLYEGFPEICKKELGFAVNDELVAMIVSGHKSYDHGKAQKKYPRLTGCWFLREQGHP